MILVQLFQIFSLFLWWWFFLFVYIYSEGANPGLVVITASYPVIAIASSVWAWITYRREKSSLAGKIISIPIAVFLLFYLAIELGLLD
jgi:hypothetical membrane protein